MGTYLSVFTDVSQTRFSGWVPHWNSLQFHPFFIYIYIARFQVIQLVKNLHILTTSTCTHARNSAVSIPKLNVLECSSHSRAASNCDLLSKSPRVVKELASLLYFYSGCQKLGRGGSGAGHWRISCCLLGGYKNNKSQSQSWSNYCDFDSFHAVHFYHMG